jgi:hypothetical protein
MAICSSLFLLTLFLLFFSQAPFTTRKSGGLSSGELGKREDNVLFIVRLVLFSDENKSLYLIFVGVVFSQHLGLLLKQLGQHLGLLLEQLGQQHLDCFVRTVGQQHLDCF